jgi:hypothetical protein
MRGRSASAGDAKLAATAQTRVSASAASLLLVARWWRERTKSSRGYHARPGRWACFDCFELQVRSGARGVRHPLLQDLDKGGFTAAAKCLTDDLDALVVHLRYPPRHRRRWRSTNLLERSLGEVKRRTKVMGRFPGEESCLSLVWAVLDLLITHETNGIHFTELDRQRLTRNRYQPAESTPSATAMLQVDAS